MAATGLPLRLDGLGFPALGPLRAQLLDELVALAADPPASRRALGISAAQDAEIDRNAALRSAPTLPAITRYTGVLYDALDVGSLRGAAAARARARLAVGSALFGLLRADDPVPAYRLSASSTLPGRPTLAARWKPLLEPVLARIADGELVVDLRSGSYAALGRLPGAVRVEVLAEHADGQPHRGQPLQQGAQGSAGPHPGHHPRRTGRRRGGGDDRAPRRACGWNGVAARSRSSSRRKCVAHPRTRPAS